ncbi:hybrid sensor histidine kinase/response regulator [Nioella nitratireducens]|uniref:hybrid sensor histidine kinase/response regulator n=1 Tax=Nioella nitratireducens TaxID=1287720 RepID=UPI0008FCEB57|nr:ATP-binding protein [Nioella nitratireducens]
MTPDRNNSLLPVPTRYHLVGLVLFGLLIFTSWSLSVSAVHFGRSLDSVRQAEGDNRVWNVTQLEVDYQAVWLALAHLRVANLRGSADDIAQAMQNLRLETDIFLSRVDVFLATARGLHLPDEVSGDVEALVHTVDIMTGMVDDLRPTDLTAIGGIDSSLLALASDVRAVTGGAMQAISAEAEVARLENKDLSATFLAKTLTLLATTLLGATIAFFLTRRLKQHAAATARANLLVRQAFDGSLGGLTVCDYEGRIVLSNLETKRIFGTGPETLRGRFLDDFIIPLIGNDANAAFSSLLLGKKDENGVILEPAQCYGRRANGEVFPLSLAIRATSGVNKEPLVLVFIRDVTEEFRAEAKIRAALEEARDSAAAKDRFLANMSHEMRTPLHGMIAALDLMQQRPSSADLDRLTLAAKKSSQRALIQVDQALAAIKGTVRTEVPVRFDPGQEARDIADELRILAEKDGLELHLDIVGAPAGCGFLGMPLCYSQTLYNLVGNALKFTSTGEVRMHLTYVCDDTGSACSLLTEVIDTGAGIPAEHHQAIFSPYQRALHSGSDGRVDGSGLGLAIARQAVQQMQGTITVDSCPGVGSRFSFTIPLATALPVTVEVSRPDPDDCDVVTATRPLSVLVVDDNRLNCELVMRMLNQLGHSASCAFSGPEAIEQADQQRFDAVLMDLRMPGMDGLEATARIQDGGASRNVPIIAITAQVDFVASDQFYQSGFCEVLVKPFSLEALDGMLTRLTVLVGQSRDPRADSESPSIEQDTRHRVSSTITMLGRDMGSELIRESIGFARAALEAAREGQPSAGFNAHRAAGALAMVGFGALSKALQELELLANAGQPDISSDLLDSVAGRLASAERLCGELNI